METLQRESTSLVPAKLFAQLNQSITTADQRSMDAALETLAAKKQEWAELPVAQKLAILDQIIEAFQGVEERWVLSALAAKDTRPRTPAEGDEWVTISIIYRLLNRLRTSLRDIGRGRRPRIPGPLRRRANGQLVARVLPANIYERIGLPGIYGDVWMQPGAEAEDGTPARAGFYFQEKPQGQVALVLAAGNIASLVCGDFLHKLFVEGQVVLLKPNPVNAYLTPLIEEAFAALIRPGYLRIINGGTDQGHYLAEHQLVETIHLTGAASTYESIVFGPGEAGAENKRRRTPRISKPFNAELGNLSPVIVVPGPWTKSDIRYQGGKMGTWWVLNAGHNCVTPRVLIHHKSWDQRQALNQSIRDFLSKVPTRLAYYPGSQRLFERFTAAHPEAICVGPDDDGRLPWTMIPDVDPANTDDIAFNQEAFVSMFAETALEADSVVEYIQKAVEFANETLWGTLVATIVVHPRSLRDPAIKAAVGQAIADLDYGSVVVNHWGALPYYTHVTPWGGAPGRDMYDIQSGSGFVNNLYMFDAPQKSVCYAPFRQIPDPYMANSTRNHEYFYREVRLHAKPSLGNLIRVLWAALRS